MTSLLAGVSVSSKAIWAILFGVHAIGAGFQILHHQLDEEKKPEFDFVLIKLYRPNKFDPQWMYDLFDLVERTMRQANEIERQKRKFSNN